MPENKSSSSKAAGTVLLAVSIIITAAALVFSVYMGGQKKTVNSYYTSVVRGEYSSFGKYFADNVLTEEGQKKLSEEYEAFARDFGLEEDGIMHVRINFKRREMISLSRAKYYFTVTYYDDDINSRTTGLKCFDLERNGTKWLLSAAEPENIE